MKCKYCNRPATRVYKAHSNPNFNFYLCEDHSDNTEWKRGHDRYVPIRIIPFKSDDSAMDNWEREWQYLCLCDEGFVMAHPKAKVYYSEGEE